MRFLKWLLIIIAILGVVYLLGPSPETPVYKTEMPSVPANAAA